MLLRRKVLEKVIAEEGYSRDQIYNVDETGLCMVAHDAFVLPELWWSNSHC